MYIVFYNFFPRTIIFLTGEEFLQPLTISNDTDFFPEYKDKETEI